MATPPYGARSRDYVDPREVLNQLQTEGDVEDKLLYPILVSSDWLSYPQFWVRSKNYLAPKNLGKGSKQKRGYYPDYSVWADGYPVAVIEAKSPDEDVLEGLKEAKLYAHEMNQGYPERFNPILVTICSNGAQIAFSHWDTNDIQTLNVEDLAPGVKKAEEFKSFCGRKVLQRHREALSDRITSSPSYVPIEIGAGVKELQRQVGPNSFAEELFPLIKLYFDAEEPERREEIIEQGYVSSEETTRYEKALETYLRERVKHVAGAPVTPIQTTKTGEDNLTTAIGSYTKKKPERTTRGQIQLLIGSVGAGKTTFLERYFSHLIPGELGSRIQFCYINFNDAPDDLSELESWLCDKFLNEIDEKFFQGQMHSIENLKRIFSPDIHKRDIGVYKYFKEKNPDKYEDKISEDLANWTDNAQKFAFSVCRYIIGDKNETIVIALDNVDRRDRDQQLRIFQVAQWFKSESRAFCILTLRDTTFERYKSEPPLDAFVKTANFYIHPPRFTDVVRKRLRLTLDYLSEETGDRQRYTLPNGIEVTYPGNALGAYLTKIYINLFNQKRQIAGVLEALSGRDVRKALSMFADIIVSKHLPDATITQNIITRDNATIPEQHVVRVLMRTLYKLFSDDHGYVTNILSVPNKERGCDNFVYIEVLEFLIERRKTAGDIGMEGYFFAGTVEQELEKLGYRPEDTRAVVQHAFERNLIISEHQGSRRIGQKDLVAVHGSGFIHSRFLLRRLEYVASALPVTILDDRGVAEKISGYWTVPPHKNDISTPTKVAAAETFLEYLKARADLRTKRNPYFAEHSRAAPHIIKSIERAIEYTKSPPHKRRAQGGLFEQADRRREPKK